MPRISPACFPMFPDSFPDFFPYFGVDTTNAFPESRRHVDVDTIDAFLEAPTGPTSDSTRLSQLHSAKAALDNTHANVQGLLAIRLSKLRNLLSTAGIRVSRRDLQRYAEQPGAHPRIATNLRSGLDRMLDADRAASMRTELEDLLRETRTLRRQERDCQVIHQLSLQLRSRSTMLGWLDARPPAMSESAAVLRPEAQMFDYLNWRRAGNSPDTVLRLMVTGPVDERYARIQNHYLHYRPYGMLSGARAALVASQAEAPAVGKSPGNEKAAVPARLPDIFKPVFRPLGKFAYKLPLSAMVKAWYKDWPPAAPPTTCGCFGAGSRPPLSLPAWDKLAGPAGAAADKKTAHTSARLSPARAEMPDLHDAVFAEWSSRLRDSLRSYLLQVHDGNFLCLHFANPRLPNEAIWAVADADSAGPCLHIVGGGLVRLEDQPLHSEKLLWVIATLMMYARINSVSFWLMGFQAPASADADRKTHRRWPSTGGRRPQKVRWGTAYTRNFKTDEDLIPDAAGADFLQD